MANILAFTIRQMERIDAAYAEAFGTDGGQPAGDDDIHSDPDIMGGAPVFRGTRVPVRTVAEMMEGGPDAEEVLAGYPSLDAARLELARRWAKDNPPSTDPSPSPNYEPRVISQKRVPRRTSRPAGRSGRKASG